MSPDQKVERFSHGELFAVDPDAIERELASLWRDAGKTTDNRHPVTRACLWNVVVHMEERGSREGTGSAGRLLELVNDLPKFLAARALALRTRAEGERELESWISANCILAEGGSKLVCSEEITIASFGKGDRHLPSLVRALLVPAVPTAAVFAGVPPESAPMTSVVGLADRVITDVDRSMVERPLARVRDAMQRAPLLAMDLGWLAAAPLRGLIAELFDPPLTVDALGGISRVRYVAPPSSRWTSHLMLGWIASALGVHTAPPKGGSTWTMPTARGGELAIGLELDSGVPGPRIEFVTKARAQPITVRAIEANVVEMPTPTGAIVRKSIAHPEGAALLARALATRSDDQAFSSAMFIAGDM